MRRLTGRPSPRRRAKNEPNSTCVLAITAPWSARVYAVARETHGRVCPLCYLLPVTCYLLASLSCCMGGDRVVRRNPLYWLMHLLVVPFILVGQWVHAPSKPHTVQPGTEGWPSLARTGLDWRTESGCRLWTGLDWRTESSFRTRTVDLNLNLRVYRRRLGSRLAMRGEGWAPSRTGQQVPERALPADRAASAGYRSTSPTSLSSSTRRRSKPSSRCASRCRGRGSTACKEQNGRACRGGVG